MSVTDKYVLKYSNELGRYMVAKDDIRQGEVILLEDPVAVGPRENSSVTCFNCFLPLGNKFGTCTKCRVAPVCRSSCYPNSKQWHTEEECKLLETLKPKVTTLGLVSNIGAVLPLRCILLMKQKDVWSDFIKMEAHLELRRESSIWKYHQKTVQFIELMEIFPEDCEVKDLVQTVCSIIDVNSFEMRAPVLTLGAPQNECVRGIYVKAAMMAHDCVGNTHVAIDDSYRMTIRASVPIERGKTIYFNYTDPLQGTFNRLRHLREGKYFVCQCSRCIDPTELGTHMSSVVCPACRRGQLCPGDPLSQTCYSAADPWICNACQKIYKGHLLKETLQILKSKYDETDKTSIKSLEDFIKLALRTVSPHHYIVVECKQYLAGLLRDSINRESSVSKRIFIRKIELCKEFLPILEKLEPGISRLRALTLYEVHTATVQLANKLFEGREIDASDLLIRLLEAEAALRESIKMLVMEPKLSPEGQLCKRAVNDLKMLRASMDAVTKNVALQEPISHKHSKVKP